MSDKSVTVELPEEAHKSLSKLRISGETTDETVQRVIEDAAEGGSGLYSLFTLVAMAGAALWLVSFVVVGESLSNGVGGIFIAGTLFWLILKEIQFRSE